MAYTFTPWDLWCWRKENGEKQPPIKPTLNEIKDRRFESLSLRQRMLYCIGLRDGFFCQRCGDKYFLALDHIFPQSKGGTDEADNLQILCHSCNSSKGARIGVV